jgi:pimeloyl-ACP methyl ester carboxylesterase
MVRYAQALEAPPLWLVGWSFGSEVALMHGSKLPVEGVIALSPPLKKTQSHHLIQWAATRKPVVGIVPENDQYLKPAEARARLAMLPAARVVEGAGAGHLWIGEKAVRQALNAVVEAVQPGLGPLPTNWDGPRQTYQNPK